MTATAPALAPDLVAGLRRLKLSTIRAIAPEICQTAKTQRWAPDEFLRTLIEAEIASRDESNLQARVKLAGFPVRKDAGRLQGPGFLATPVHLRLPCRPGVDPSQGELPVGRSGGHWEVAPIDRAWLGRRTGRPPGALLHRRRLGRNPLPRPG